MRAVVCEAYGPVEDLKFTEVDVPVAGEGEVLIDVVAAGCNAPDALIIQGEYQIKPTPPFSPGGEGAGVISALGKGVEGFKEGDRVLFYSLHGAFADKIVVAVDSVVGIPDEMPMDIAAGFMAAYGTSYHAFKQRAMVQPGEHVLVLGAGGGVGLAAVNVAKAMGAKVIASDIGEEKLNVCLELGADWAIDPTKQDLKKSLLEITGRSDVDVTLDTVGGDVSEQVFRLMAVYGRHLVIGFVAGSIPRLPLNLPLLKEASVVGVFWNSFLMREHSRHLENMRELYQLHKEGALKPVVCQKFPLEEYASAFEFIAQRRAIGKVVLDI
jgi:NADPH2:quinone reductase